jgi:hypothetical protein
MRYEGSISRNQGENPSSLGRISKGDMASLRRTQSTDGGTVHAPAASRSIDASDYITITLMNYRGLSREVICATSASWNVTQHSDIWLGEDA